MEQILDEIGQELLRLEDDDYRKSEGVDVSRKGLRGWMDCLKQMKSGQPGSERSFFRLVGDCSFTTSAIAVLCNRLAKAMEDQGN